MPKDNIHAKAAQDYADKQQLRIIKEFVGANFVCGFKCSDSTYQVSYSLSNGKSSWSCFNTYDGYKRGVELIKSLFADNAPVLSKNLAPNAEENGRKFAEMINKNAKNLRDHVIGGESLSEKRKKQPIYSGVLQYFPDALMAVSRQSFAGNEKHNAGEPLHWAREKSSDHLDCAVRHMLNPDEIDPETGETHLVSAAWRVLAQLQLQQEKMGGKY